MNIRKILPCDISNIIGKYLLPGKKQITLNKHKCMIDLKDKTNFIYKTLILEKNFIRIERLEFSKYWTLSYRFCFWKN